MPWLLRAVHACGPDLSMLGWSADPDPGTLAHFCYLSTKMWAYAVGVLLVFTITFSVFPGEITTIKYEGTFAMFDALGVGYRACMSSHGLRKAQWLVPLCCAARRLVANRVGHHLQLL